MIGRRAFNPFSRVEGRVFIMSPARPPSRAKIARALKLFDEAGLNYSLSKNIFACGSRPAFPAPPDRRAAEFNSAVADSSVGMILCARGGYGTSDMLPLIDWKALRRRGTIVMGFSDITALHLAMIRMKAGVALAGPMLSDIPESFKRNYAGLSLEKALSGDRGDLDISRFREIRSLKAGSAEGEICVANLTVLSSMIGTGFMPSLEDKILLVEDLNEPFHKIYRYISHLRLAGVFDGISGLLLGNFRNCGGRRDLGELFASLARSLRVPVLSGIPFGHIRRILSIRLGAMVLLEKGRLLLR